MNTPRNQIIVTIKIDLDHAEAQEAIRDHRLGQFLANLFKGEIYRLWRWFTADLSGSSSDSGRIIPICTMDFTCILEEADEN